jgi:hypothetical protein
MEIPCLIISIAMLWCIDSLVKDAEKDDGRKNNILVDNQLAKRDHVSDLPESLSATARIYRAPKPAENRTPQGKNKVVKNA